MQSYKKEYNCKMISFSHIAFTICTESYLAGALVWRKSLYDSESGIRAFIYVIDVGSDDLSRICSESKSVSETYAEGLDKDLRCVRDAIIPDNAGMRNRYDIIEYCTAIKPSIFLALAREFSGCVLHYFDPDIAIFGDLLGLRVFSEEHSMTLIPHMITPTEDNFKLTQLQILQAGVFNFGYVGWNPNYQSGWTLIKWWQARLNKDCRVAIREGIFTDQSWGVFFCSSPEVGIFHDLSYNVAYWNLHERYVDWTLQSGFTCNGEKLQFYHFSGYSPGDPLKLSIHQNRHHLAGLRGLSRLFSCYLEELRSAGIHKWQKQNSKASLEIQKTVHKTPRKSKKNAVLMDVASHSIYAAFNDPNHARIIYGITWWILYITLFIANQLASLKKIYKIEIANLLAETIIRRKHKEKNLITKGLLYWRYYILSIIDNFIKTRRECNLSRKTNVKKDSSTHPLLMTESEIISVKAIKSSGNKIAVIGYITAETGLGESVRGIIRSMDISHKSADLYDIKGHYARSFDNEFADRIQHTLDPSQKYKTCLLHVNADQVPHLLQNNLGSILLNAEKRIGYWYWETESLPYGQAAAANYFDEIWVATEFVREALITSGVKTPVKVIPPALSALPDVPYGRSHFDLPEDRKICLCVFDATSFLGRKNPGAVIQALKKLYTDNEITPLLVLKTTNLKDADREEIFRLAGQVDVHIINKYLSREETLSLVALSDCFISLHRAEGLGLSLIDAMRLNTPLVCTNYSGPKDFVNDDNAFLVPWKYCQARWEDGPYFGSRWADPDIEVAASQIRMILKNNEVVQNRLMRAKQNVEEHFSEERIADLIRRALL